MNGFPDTKTDNINIEQIMSPFKLLFMRLIALKNLVHFLMVCNRNYLVHSIKLNKTLSKFSFVKYFSIGIVSKNLLCLYAR